MLIESLDPHRSEMLDPDLKKFMWIRNTDFYSWIRIQKAKQVWIHADPDPHHCYIPRPRGEGVL